MQPASSCSKQNRNLHVEVTNLPAKDSSFPGFALIKSTALRQMKGAQSLQISLKGARSFSHRFMFGPGYTAGCPSCSAITDGFNGFAIHLSNHDVMLWAVSRAPFEKLQTYKKRMGWSFPWVSSSQSDFDHDFQTKNCSLNHFLSGAQLF